MAFIQIFQSFSLKIFSLMWGKSSAIFCKTLERVCRVGGSLVLVVILCEDPCWSDSKLVSVRYYWVSEWRNHQPAPSTSSFCTCVQTTSYSCSEKMHKIDECLATNNFLCVLCVIMYFIKQAFQNKLQCASVQQISSKFVPSRTCTRDVQCMQGVQNIFCALSIWKSWIFPCVFWWLSNF